MKLQGKHMMGVGFLACALAALQLTAHTLGAAPGKPGDVVVVDIAELQKSYKQYVDDVAKFQQFQEVRARRFDARQGLKPEEWDELDALEAKDEKKLKPEETKRLEELRGLTERRKKAIRELSSKPDATEKDKEELKRLNDIPRVNQVRLEELNDKLVQEIERERGRLTENLRKALTKAYGDLAKERSYKVIFDKATLQWSEEGIDITQDVLKKLNR